MSTYKRIITLVSLISVLLLGTHCTKNQPTPISMTTPLPAKVEVINIQEANTISNMITQQKEFDHCASASPLKASIRFSRSSSQEVQNELVLKGKLGGEAAIVPEIVKITLEGEIEKHFGSTQSDGSGHEETVEIEVPGHSKQRYTIVWEEKRREGTVEYVENGEIKSLEYSYAIGVELASVKVEDLVCEGQERVIDATPTPYPTYTPYPTFTPAPKPTNTPQPRATPTLSPTSGPTPTPPNTGLTVGEYYTQGSASLTVEDYDFGTYGGAPWVYVTFLLRNVGAHKISFEYGTQNFVAKDNLGTVYESLQTSPRIVNLDPGEQKYLTGSGNIPVQWVFSGNYVNPKVTSITITVQNLSAIEYAEWIIPVHH